MWKKVMKLPENVDVIRVAVSSLRHADGNFNGRYGTGWREYDFKVALRYAKLMASGTLLPLMEVVRRKDGRYEVTDGNHRLYAVRRLGVKKVPVLLFPE